MPTAKESLDDYLRSIDPTPTDEELGAARTEALMGWAVTDDGLADWALRRVAVAKSRRKEVQALHESQLQQLNGWREKELQSCDQTIFFFEDRLASWAPDAIAKSNGDKARSLRLPHGLVGFRKTQPDYERDDSALLAEARQNSLPVRVKEEADWSAIKAKIIGETSTGDAVLEGGVVLHSVQVRQRPDTFYTKTEEE